MDIDFLPQHLRKYVVTQNYDKYTPVDQAVWRYILRQLKAYLSVHAHECYTEGLEKTGIGVESIPRIEDISEKLKKFGWRALPVSGFIPPAAFMELQSLGVLPIASDMRTLDHLLYTPAPDIVHEAAGHAPILIHPEFSAYLQQYAQVAKKAILSQEDLDMYEAIRELSDIKESPQSSPQEIQRAEKHLEKVSQNISHVSEAAELSRMNWWTAEYGLIGSLDKPQIFGAGLLSSVGEAKWCLNEKVRKIPLTVDCIKTTYDITEPQPQLFVTPDFKTLGKVLEDMASQMAYRTGGIKGLNKALLSKAVNTAQLDSGLQISGVISEVIKDGETVSYLRTLGPTQLAFQDKELSGHNKEYHAHGFGSPVGYLKKFSSTPLADFTEEDWKSFETNGLLKLEYTSGVVVEGRLKKVWTQSGKTILLTLTEATVRLGELVLFDPAWGVYDMAIGSVVSSVFGGPADRIAYGEMSDFVAKRVPLPRYTESEKRRHRHYGLIREFRERKLANEELTTALDAVLEEHMREFPEDWLLYLEAYELLKNRAPKSLSEHSVSAKLFVLRSKSDEWRQLIDDGAKLAEAL